MINYFFPFSVYNKSTGIPETFNRLSVINETTEKDTIPSIVNLVRKSPYNCSLVEGIQFFERTAQLLCKPELREKTQALINQPNFAAQNNLSNRELDAVKRVLKDFQNISRIKKPGNTPFSFSEMLKLRNQGKFDFTCLGFLCEVRGDLNLKVFDFSEEDFQTQEAKDFFTLIKHTEAIRLSQVLDLDKVNEVSQFLENNKPLIQDLIVQLDSGKGLNSKQIGLFLQCFQTLYLFKASSLKNISLLEGFQNKEILERLINLSNNKEDYIFADFIAPLSFFKTNSAEQISQKIQLLEQAIQENRLAEIPNEDKLRKTEWLSLLLLYQVGNNYSSPTLKPLLKQIERLINYTYSPGKDLILVTSQNTKEESRFFKARNPDFFDRIMSLFEEIICLLFTTYGHSRFVSYNANDYKFRYHGKDCHERNYIRKFSGVNKEFFEEYEIDATSLIPQEITQEKIEKFSSTFFSVLNIIINTENPYLKSFNIIHLFKMTLPSLTEENPRHISVTNPKARIMSCAEYVISAIIEAHIKTCYILELPAPNNLEYYGFKKREHPSNILSEKMIKILKGRNILKLKPKFTL